jgi:C-terminal processing protease CtpA/Prc
MSKLWCFARRMAVCAVVALSVAAGGVGISGAQAPQGAPADNGVVGIAIGLTAHTIGAPARLVVERVLPGGPAAKAGVHRGDEIRAIDGHPVNGKSLREITQMIRGKVGTPVTLAISEKTRTREVTLTRVTPPQWHGSPNQSPH